MFFTRVCDSVHRGGLQRTPLTRQTPPPPDQADTTPAGRTPPGPRRTPPDQADPPGTKENPPRPGRPPRTKENPPGPRRTPRTRQTPPGPRRPPREEDCSIRSMSGWYASYWNAFLLFNMFSYKLSSKSDLDIIHSNWRLNTTGILTSCILKKSRKSLRELITIPRSWLDIRAAMQEKKSWASSVESESFWGIKCCHFSFWSMKALAHVGIHLKHWISNIE